ncbi:macro domain-containing protein [Roseovarius atlanticus]|uniref:macro domain-containing protein n=1 Tax=Roseovarius atlanticus TaxID=1641875 RepID=UPI001C95CCE4|nr:macro domain-containing protein [Roseovarius atlanticus]MBY5989434.1 macro domain-containing protein [Roseovarius atlanticus]MBY6124826.1 macro domain-containing protein [Roseovarius atlanticus]MBY6149321.1 macro domain-containing protein [Roseovarius atlanticus]
MRRIEGDLIALAKSGHFDVLVHGCNCFHTVGAGIAKIIAKEFPAAAQADIETPKGDRAKLGTISHATVACDGHSLTIVNAYTQFDYRGRGQKVDYSALQSAFEAVAAQFPAARIGYPLIGAGLAGGDWDEIAPRIDTALDGMDHALVVLPDAGR